MNQDNLTLKKLVLELAFVDLVVAAWSFAGVTIFVEGSHRSLVTPSSMFWPFALGILVIWLVALSLLGTRNQSILGLGATEYQRVFLSVIVWLGASSTFGIALNANISFLFLVGLAIVGLILTLFGRWVMRQMLVFRRSTTGMLCSKVFVVGKPENVDRVIAELSGARAWGLDVVGSETMNSYMLTAEQIVGSMRSAGADTLVLAGGNSHDPSLIKEISWNLSSGSERLILPETLTDIAGPRIQLRYLPNISLIEVAAPTFAGASRFGKRAFDVLISTLMLFLLAPLFLAITVAIKLTSHGGVAFFKQTRVGLGGKLFTMWKFRTMVANAEELRSGLLDDPSRNTNEVLFKNRNDPRITSLGKLLRRFSLDELPQLFNVMRGDMSIVGPRPPLPEELLKYEDHVRRRFLVKPGMTGLWQVSGRADLNWRDTVRFDLYYVENWSVLQDLQIIWRTFAAVFAGKGAY